MDSKPIFVIVPGAWCPSTVYEPLTSRLQNAGYTVDVLNLPSNGRPPTMALTWDNDVQLIAASVQSHVAAGNEVVVVAHSAGGASATQAVQNLSSTEIELAGGRGGVTRLAYIAAFAPPEGTSEVPEEQLLQMFPWVIRDGELDYPDPDKLTEILFHDLKPKEALAYSSLVRASAWRARHSSDTRVTYAGWKHIRSSYLLCENDRVVSPDLIQEPTVKQIGGKFEEVLRVKCGHFPFLSQPDLVARFLRRAAGEQESLT